MASDSHECSSNKNQTPVPKVSNAMFANNDILIEISTQIIPSQNLHDLEAKIDRLRDIILDFSNIEKQTHRNVRQLLSEIFEDAKRLKIHKDELRRMLHEAFNSGGSRAAKISESYLRRLMPLEYKNATKIRLDYRINMKEKQRNREHFRSL